MENSDHFKNPYPKPKKKKSSLYKFLVSELTRGYFLENDEAKFEERSARVMTFMKIPWEMEKFVMFGMMQCTDAFLFFFTFLPPRFLLAITRLVTHPCGFLKSGSRRPLESAQICDILKGVIMIATCLILARIDTSMMYHIVRGQAIIKLYIFFNMLEIADRLFASFGQDIFDSLLWSATEKRNRKREHFGVIPLLFVAIIYTFFHAMLIMFQATTLNVAFNSHNKALLTIMMSNNFVEIKGSVFKKFAKNNLFQMSCSDVRERFHYHILLLIVVIRNMAELNWDMDHLWQLFPDIIMVTISEVLVDWLKHAFIVKFNNLSSDVYKEYTISLAYDTACSRKKDAFSDHSDLISRKMGFTPIPLGCLLIHIVSQSINVESYVSALAVFLGFLVLFSTKVLNSIIMLGHTCDYINEYSKSKKQESDERNRTESDCIPMRRFSIPTETPIQKTPITTHKRSNSDVESPMKVSDMYRTDDRQETTIRNRKPSFLPKPLFPDGPVQVEDIKPISRDNERDKERSPKKSTTTPISVLDEEKPPLNDIDRYSMVSNRIV